MFVSGLEFFEVLKSPPEDPFLSPQVALRDLLLFRVHEAPGHRKVTRGVVNFVYPGRFLFIQEGNTGIRVDSVDAEMRPGMEVEVAGFVTRKHALAGLGGAVVRPTGGDPGIEAMPVTSMELLNPSLRVDAGSPDLLLPVATQLPLTEIIGENKDHVIRCAIGGIGKPGQHHEKNGAKGKTAVQRTEHLAIYENATHGDQEPSEWTKRAVGLNFPRFAHRRVVQFIRRRIIEPEGLGVEFQALVQAVGGDAYVHQRA